MINYYLLYQKTLLHIHYGGEGKYIPFINFWQRAGTTKECNKLNKRLRKLDTNTGYKIGVEDKEYISVLFNIFIYPDFIETEDGGYEFIKKDCSIEEMLTMLETFLKDR